MGTTCLTVRITHPFHPRHGQEIDVVCRRRHWGEDRLVYLDGGGRLCSICVSLTDVDPPDEFRRIAAGRAAFRTDDLVELRGLLDRLVDRMESDDA